ncbi:MAG: hypothetical protein ACMUIP_02535 [bacterium]
MITELLILNTINEATDCVSKKLYTNRYIVTTHISVTIYLREVCHIESECIDRFFSNHEMRNNVIAFGDKVDEILRTLDSDFAPYLNKKYGLHMKYFQPLYSYQGKQLFTVIYYFSEALRRICAHRTITQIYLYTYRLNRFTDGILDTYTIVSTLYPDIKIEIIEQDLPHQEAKVFKNTVALCKELIYNPKLLIHGFDKIVLKLRKVVSYDARAQTILLHDPLYELKFLRKRLNSYNILFFTINKKKNKKALKNTDYSKECIHIDLDNFNDNPLIILFLQDIQADFNKNIHEYLSKVDVLRLSKRKNDIALGIWGNPPVGGDRALLYEYLLSKDIPVIGAQHGSAYCELFSPWHFDSDFNRCDYFFSYGFTKNDLKRVYPDRKPRCVVLPVGRVTNSIGTKKKKKKIDILFPLSNTKPVFYGGMVRISPSNLAARQITLLEFLDSLKDFNVIVKPHQGATFENCGPLIMVNRLKRVKVEKRMTLNTYLQKNMPRAVLIEYPSTPLYDCIPLDTEIFLLTESTTDAIKPYDDHALQLLSKRVHYADTIESIIKKMTSFYEGTLESKRDDTFYNHYVHKDKSKKNILGYIDTILHGVEKSSLRYTESHERI